MKLNHISRNIAVVMLLTAILSATVIAVRSTDDRSAVGSSDEPRFWIVHQNEFTTFELHGHNAGSRDRRCRVTVTITKENGDTKDFHYEVAVPAHTSGKEFAKETGYGRITAKISSQGCEQ